MSYKERRFAVVESMTNDLLDFISKSKGTTLKEIFTEKEEVIFKSAVDGIVEGKDFWLASRKKVKVKKLDGKSEDVRRVVDALINIREHLSAMEEILEWADVSVDRILDREADEVGAVIESARILRKAVVVLIQEDVEVLKNFGFFVGMILWDVICMLSSDEVKSEFKFLRAVKHQARDLTEAVLKQVMKSLE